MPRRGRGSKAELDQAATAAGEAVEAAATAADEGTEQEFDEALEEAQAAIAELKEQVKWLKDNLPKAPEPDPDLPALKTTLKTATETIQSLQTQVRELADKASQEPPKKAPDSATTGDLETPGIKAPLPAPPPAAVSDSSMLPATGSKKTEAPMANAPVERKRYRLI